MHLLQIYIFGSLQLDRTQIKNLKVSMSIKLPIVFGVDYIKIG